MHWADITARVLVISLLARFLQPRYQPLLTFIHREIANPPLQAIPDQSCERLIGSDPAFWSCEHFAVWKKDGFEAVITGCDSNRKVWNPVMGPTFNSTSTGSLFLIPTHPSLPLYPTNPANTDTTISPRKPIAIPIVDAPLHFNFHPLGLAIWKSEEEDLDDRLFVVNWANVRSRVEVFDLEMRGGKVAARWVRSVEFKEGQGLDAPNSLVATSRSSFYVSFDHYFTHRLPSSPDWSPGWLVGLRNAISTVPTVFETFLIIPGGKIARIDLANGLSPADVVVQDVTGWMPFPNGIAMSPVGGGLPTTTEPHKEGNYMAVAHTSSSRLVILKRSDTGTFAKINSFQLPFFPDNLIWQPLDVIGRSEILVAGHPSLRKMKKIIHGTAVFAPSYTVSIQVVISAEGNISLGPATAVYRSDGDPEKGGYGTSASAGRDGSGRLWLSGLYVEGMMVCEGGKGEVVGEAE